MCTFHVKQLACMHEKWVLTLNTFAVKSVNKILLLDLLFVAIQRVSAYKITLHFYLTSLISSPHERGI